MPKRRSKKAAYWRDILRQQRESGRNARQFCRDHELSEASFYSWRRKLETTDHQAASSVAGGSSSSGVKKAGRQHVGASLFVPLQLTSGSSSVMELVHPRGHVLRIPPVFDEGSLRKVLELLEREGAA